jgi:hypothetical protein
LYGALVVSKPLGSQWQSDYTFTNGSGPNASAYVYAPGTGVGANATVLSREFVTLYAG